MNFFCLWIPQFAAWAMAQTQAHLQDKPFAVCEGGQVIAVSPLAVEAGVRVGMTTWRAQLRLESLLIIERDSELEKEEWEKVQRIIYEQTAKIEAVEVGLLFAQLDARKVLPLLKRWGAHGGEAGDRANAHIAALSSPVGYARIVKSGREKGFADLAPLSVLQKAGISAKTVSSLSSSGWERVGHLRKISRRQFEEQCGEEGLAIYAMAQGRQYKENLRPIEKWIPTREITATFDFEVPAREPDHWNEALDELLHQACQNLGTMQAHTLEVTAHTPIAPTKAKRLLQKPLSNPVTLRKQAEVVLQEALHTLLPLPSVVLRLEIRLGGLTSLTPSDMQAEEILLYSPNAQRARRIGNKPSQTETYTLDESTRSAAKEQFEWFSSLFNPNRKRATEKPEFQEVFGLHKVESVGIC